MPTPLYDQLNNLTTEERNPISAHIDEQSIGDALRIINDEDKKALQELLPHYGFDLTAEDYDKFRKIVPRSKRPFYGKESEEG